MKVTSHHLSKMLQTLIMGILHACPHMEKSVDWPGRGWLGTLCPKLSW